LESRDHFRHHDLSLSLRFSLSHDCIHLLARVAHSVFTGTHGAFLKCCNIGDNGQYLLARHQHTLAQRTPCRPSVCICVQYGLGCYTYVQQQRTDGPQSRFVWKELPGSAVTGRSHTPVSTACGPCRCEDTVGHINRMYVCCMPQLLPSPRLHRALVRRTHPPFSSPSSLWPWPS
jgi:hypothetical protein